VGRRPARRRTAGAGEEEGSEAATHHEGSGVAAYHGELAWGKVVWRVTDGSCPM
jgi:hypothetical protein